MRVETRRILLDGVQTSVRANGDELVAPDGRRISSEKAVHLPPVMPTKIICTHLTYRSRVEELKAKLPPAPTYFHKPVSCLCYPCHADETKSSLNLFKLGNSEGSVGETPELCERRDRNVEVPCRIAVNV